jgi:thioredoxin 1
MKQIRTFEDFLNEDEVNESSLLAVGQNKVDINDTDLAKIDQLTKIPNKLIIMDISAEWCGPCQRMKKHFDELLVDPKYKDKFVLAATSDFSFSSPLAKKYKITGIPYVMLFKNGKMVHKYNREQNKQYIIDLINKFK